MTLRAGYLIQMGEGCTWLQFIAGLRNWQNFSYDDKMKFTYKIYDLDGSGFIEPTELVRSTSCISEMHLLSCFQ